MAQVGLFDRIEIHPADNSGWTLTCSDPAIPVDSTNLVLRAAAALQEANSCQRPGGRIHIEKQIPVGGGLGGGSSNAATALRLLNRYWRLGKGDADLAKIGAQVGSDVPLFLHSSPCIMRGRGEQIEPFQRMISGWVALMLTGLTCATRNVYAAFDQLTPPPIRSGVAEIGAAPCSADEFMRKLFNDLEPAAIAVSPKLQDLFSRIDALAPGRVRMTGSGSSLFRLFDSEIDAREFAERVQKSIGVRCIAVRLLNQ